MSLIFISKTKTNLKKFTASLMQPRNRTIPRARTETKYEWTVTNERQTHNTNSDDSFASGCKP